MIRSATISEKCASSIAAVMGEETKSKIGLEELMVSTLAMTDALAKLIIGGKRLVIPTDQMLLRRRYNRPFPEKLIF